MVARMLRHLLYKNISVSKYTNKGGEKHLNILNHSERSGNLK